jgi:Holliday junction resolvase RusA-like endonuclease
MSALSFIVPGVPVPKARPRVVRTNGGVRGVTPAATRAWEQTVGAYALQARQALRVSWPLAARYAVTIEAVRDRRGDMDNILKSALDGCNGILWGDDAQVDGIQAWRRPLDAQGPRLVVLVTVLEAP